MQSVCECTVLVVWQCCCVLCVGVFRESCYNSTYVERGHDVAAGSSQLLVHLKAESLGSSVAGVLRG